MYGIAITNNGFMLLKLGFFEFIKMGYLPSLCFLRYIWLFGFAHFVLMLIELGIPGIHALLRLGESNRGLGQDHGRGPGRRLDRDQDHCQGQGIDHGHEVVEGTVTLGFCVFCVGL